MRRFALYIPICALIAVVVTGCGPRTLSEQQGQALLRDIRDAQRNTAVKGEIVTRIRLGDGLVSAEGKVHRGRGRMQLEFTSGRADGARIVQQKGQVWQISPDGETVRRLPHNPVDDVRGFGRTTRVTVRRGGRVAGRATSRTN